MRIVLLPTLDYEVFHGRNFAGEAEVLFRPTERLLRRAEQARIPFTLFADVFAVPAYRRSGLQAFVDTFERQLRRSVAGGHDVQLHVHPHWLSASFESGNWSVRNPMMTLAEWEPDSSRPLEIIREGIAYLETLLRPDNPEYRCVAFRAGGLALQPRQRDLLHALERCGIAIDSSVAKDYVARSDAISVDYRNAPAPANWLDGEIFEIPIATFRMPLHSRMEFLLRRAVAVAQKRRGAPISRARRQTRLRNALTLLRLNLRYLRPDVAFLFSADTKGFTRKMLVDGFKNHVRRHARDTTIYVSMLNHPKLLFEPQERMLFEVLEDLRDRYGEALRFATFREVAAEMQEEREHLHW